MSRLFLIALILSLPRYAPAQTQPPLRNAIVISIDSLRADHLSFHGYPRATTPNLEKAMRDRGALVFQRATAVSPACHPSHATILLGLYPQQVGVPWCAEDLVVRDADFSEDEDVQALAALQAEEKRRPVPLTRKRVSAIANWLKIPQANENLASFLKARGFRTGGFMSIWTIQKRFGYDRGFDFFSDDMPEYYGPPQLTWLLRDALKGQRRQVGSVTIDRTVEYLASLGKDERFFLFVHLADTHVPYAPRTAPPFAESAKERQRLEELWRARYAPTIYERAMKAMQRQDGFLLDRYDEAIRYADVQLARLFAWLEERGQLDQTLIVLTSDHGDSMGQHLYLSERLKDRLFFEHSVYVWEETQHVPMVVFDPAVHDLTVRQANVSQIDIVPTAISRLGFDVSRIGSELPGRDLTQLGDDPRTVYFFTFGRGRPGLFKRSFQEYPKFIGFRSGNRKFFVDRDRFKNPKQGRCFLYDLAEDPNELDNLCLTTSPEAIAAHRRKLVDWYDHSVAGRKRGAPPAWLEQ